MRMRNPRAFVLFLAVAAVGLHGVKGCNPQSKLVQVREQIPGYVEPHTPGSGAPEEFIVPNPGRIVRIVGPDVSLNNVDYVRTYWTIPGKEDLIPPPKAIMILIPGFLGGAGTFDPIARDLVDKLRWMEVWAVDRRSNQLEDRRGALYARDVAEAPGADLASIQAAIEDGVRFYFGGVDLDGDGVDDDRFRLPDAIGGTTFFRRLGQNHARAFMAHWGVDTYVRDWRELVLAAREIVGEGGLVFFGGHSMGTTWTGAFAAYDFDPGPGVEAGYELVDGLVLLEGGGLGTGSATPPDLTEYQAAVADLEATNGEDVFLTSLFGFIDAVSIGAAGELNGLAGTFDPAGDSVVQKTPLFSDFPVSILLQAPMTNRSLVGFFLDDDFSTNPAFSASMGFSANGSNVVNPLAGFGIPGDFYLAIDEGVTRTWINYDSPRFDPGDPDPLTCPPLLPPPHPTPSDFGETGCAILDNGPMPPPGETGLWGWEREVTDIDTFTRTLYETGNASEWYFVSGRPSLDLSFGRDSTSLGAPELLNVSQHANIDIPVLGIGGSNGLANTEASFASYFDSIASPNTQAVILEGYSHVDVVSAAENEAVPVIAQWIQLVVDLQWAAP